MSREIVLEPMRCRLVIRSGVFIERHLALKHWIKAGPLPLPSCDGVESRGPEKVSLGAAVAHHAMALAWVQKKFIETHYHGAAA